MKYAIKRLALAPLLLGLMGSLFSSTMAQDNSDEKPPKVTIGSKAFTESVLLGEIATLLAKETGAEVRHRKELGGTQILWQALLGGEIDAYPEYTGTIAEEILQDRSMKSEDLMRAALAKKGVRMSLPLGFGNSYEIGMRRTHAEELGISRISDLVKFKKLQLGLSEEFMEREDGWPGLKSAYGLTHQPRGMDHSLAYKGLASGGIDAMDLYSTDAEISLFDLVILEDDRNYFPNYHAVWLYREDLEKRAPAVVKQLTSVEGKIDVETMIALNRGAKVEKRSDQNLAAEFLNGELGAEIAFTKDSRVRQLIRATLEHLALVSISLLAAVVTAIPVGIAAFRWKKLGQWLLSAISVLQTIPSMALLVMLIPILGLGAEPAVAALFLYSLLPIVRNTHAGLTGISAAHRETAEVLGLSSKARLLMIELPLASPSIFSGIKTAAVINVGTATIGALVGAGGYGSTILTGIRLNDLTLILLGAVPAGLMALGVQGLFSLIERFVVPKGLQIA